MPWELKNDRPIYLQLIERIKQLILSGVYPPGTKLPSVRELASVASVNPNTMQKALSELEQSGLIYTNRTSGRFITEDSDMINDMKWDLAKQQLEIFIQQLLSLGFERNEIYDLLEKAAENQKSPDLP